MRRRSLLKAVSAATVLGVLPMPASLQAGEVARSTKRSGSFDYAWLKGHARYLAGRAYQPQTSGIPASLDTLSWDDYQAIRFKPQDALWRGDDLLFQVQLFHLGLYFKKPVQIFEVDGGIARALEYRQSNFDYSGKQALGNLKSNLGYAGFRLHFYTNFQLDLASFLGASYFRAVGESMQYGLSARGLAVDTGMSRKEEFPEFTTFWLEKPAPGQDFVTVWALLDSPSVTGAYAFRIQPGQNTVMDVDVALYPRKAIERVGIAPLTSMYQMGENDRRMAYDWRPEIHDSDGLAIQNGNNEWLWRPLTNPRNVHISSFVDNNLKGFGLLQRDRNFEHYQDDGVFYNRRPSAWITPKGDWGLGQVMLTEIPTGNETFDNIVAFWNPQKPLVVGKEHLFSYTLTWGEEPPVQPDKLAQVQATRTGLGGIIGQQRDVFSWRFAIDFGGGDLSMLASDTELEAVITTSSGRVEITSVRPLDSIKGYRAMFDLVPGESGDPVDIRLQLMLSGQPVSETWLYQYTPPPADEQARFLDL